MADLIESIRSKWGCYTDEHSHQALNTTAGLLQLISEDLNTKSSHFVLELVQNADDNKYPDGVVPTLNVLFQDSQITVTCNEIGFTEADVRGICGVASTKRNVPGTIGEKGIGFKSIFKVADKVYISSGKYTFMFSMGGGHDYLGMVIPSWAERHPSRPHWTSFYLYLASALGRDELIPYDVKPTVLLFLRNLRRLNLFIWLPDSVPEVRFIARKDIGSYTVIHRVDRPDLPLEKYFKVKHQTETYPNEKKRKGIVESEVVLAFPLLNNGTPKIERQDVHAFLPLRDYGFSFIVQADFLTSANREDMLENEWNMQLRDSIVNAFSAAVERFKQEKYLKFTWLRFLPEVLDGFFTPVGRAIIQNLQCSKVLLTADNTYQPPTKCINVRSGFRGANKVPLLPKEYLQDDLHYLSLSYISADLQHIRRLGVGEMSNIQFIRGLQNMGREIRKQPLPWQEAVCHTLTEILERHPWESIFEIKQISIIPLSDGSWVSADSVEDVFFASNVEDIPSDLELQFVDGSVEQTSPQYKLFEKLGLMKVDGETVVNRILEKHSCGDSIPWDLDLLICHARFLYSHKYLFEYLDSPLGLLVMTDEGEVCDACDTYYDFPDLGHQIRMLDVLPSPAKFLNPQYLENKDWSKWLRNVAGINTSPRLINGQLSPEFETLSRTVDTGVLLTVLERAWPKWQQTISPAAVSWLKNIEVRCEDGSRRALKKCYLKRLPLKKFSDLPFLLVQNPDSNRWNFLRQLDVIDQVDGDFHLRRLMSLRDTSVEDTEQIIRIYRQLESRFHEWPSVIRNAFDVQPLIFVFDDVKKTRRWIARGDAVWAGPPSITSKTVLQTLYPEFHEFFQDQLKIQNAGPEILHDEILEISACSRNKYCIPEPERDRIYGLLQDMSHAIEQDMAASYWLKKLSRAAIFPVRSPSGKLTLQDADGDFYIPDKSERFTKVFAPYISILSIPSGFLLTDIQPILESTIFKRLRWLESEVSVKSDPQGVCSLQGEISEKFASIASFVERTILSKRSTQRSGTVLGLVEKLVNIQVFTVDSIKSIITLGGFERVYPEKVLITEDDLSVYITEEAFAEPGRDIQICSKLADLLGLDLPNLLNFVKMSASEVGELLRIQNIAELSDGLRRHVHLRNVDAAQAHVPGSFGRDIGQTAGAESVPVATASSHHARTLSTPSPTPSGGDSDSDSDPEMDCLGRAMADGLSIGPQTVTFKEGGGSSSRPNETSERTTFSSGARDVTASYIESVSTCVNEIHGRAISSSPRMSNGNSPSTRPRISSFQMENGKLGEEFVSDKLSEMLPGFGPKNRTSSERGSLADFRYEDEKGTLTGILFGEQKKTAWEFAWPTYYLEVKTTSVADEQEKFYMSKPQCMHASKLSIRNPDTAPENVYVLIRVSDIRDSPTLRFFPDPHHMFYTGQLQIVSEVTVQVAPEE